MISSKSLTLAIVGAAAAFFVGSASAQNLLSNAGFETPVLAPGAVQNFATGSTIGGAWLVLGTPSTTPVGIVQTTASEPANGITQFNAQQGLNSLDLTGPGNTGLNSGVRQTISTAIGQVYLLSFFVGRASGGAVYATPSTLTLSINSGVLAPFTNANSTAGMVNWQQFVTSFTATSALTTIDFFNGTLSNNEVGLDNVVLTAVPEGSATWALLAIGLMATFALRFLLRERVTGIR